MFQNSSSDPQRLLGLFCCLLIVMRTSESVLIREQPQLQEKVGELNHAKTRDLRTLGSFARADGNLAPLETSGVELSPPRLFQFSSLSQPSGTGHLGGHFFPCVSPVSPENNLEMITERPGGRVGGYVRGSKVLPMSFPETPAKQSTGKCKHLF